MKYTIARQIDRVAFRIMRSLPFFRETLVRVRSGPLKNYRMTVKTGNPYLFGYYEEDAIRRICQYIGPNDVVYDLGANAGYYAMTFAQRTTNCVHAFEPMPEFQELLQRHLRVNQVLNVVVHALAVSESSGTREFSNVAASLGNTYVASSSSFDLSNSTITVNTVSLDDLVYVRNLEPPNVIKIDVEGAELDVLMGAKRVLQEYRPFLLLGTHEVHLTGVSQKCCSYLQSLGYSVLPTAEEKSASGLADFICLPPGK